MGVGSIRSTFYNDDGDNDDDPLNVPRGGCVRHDVSPDGLLWICCEHGGPVDLRDHLTRPGGGGEGGEEKKSKSAFVNKRVPRPLLAWFVSTTATPNSSDSLSSIRRNLARCIWREDSSPRPE